MKNTFQTPKLEMPLVKVVRKLLTKFPNLRSNDNELIVAVWKSYHKELRGVHMTFLMFAYKFAKGCYVNPESIRRTRQLVQNKYPELRDPNTHANREEYAEEFKADVIEMKNSFGDKQECV